MSSKNFNESEANVESICAQYARREVYSITCIMQSALFGHLQKATIAKIPVYPQRPRSKKAERTSVDPFIKQIPKSRYESPSQLGHKTIPPRRYHKVESWNITHTSYRRCPYTHSKCTYLFVLVTFVGFQQERNNPRFIAIVRWLYIERTLG